MADTKLTRRKGFNFYRSYYDVFNELNKKDQLEFITALLHKQFLGREPKGLTGASKFAYVSQRFNIDAQVDGFESKTNTQLPESHTYNPPTEGGVQGGSVTPTVQEEEKEEEEVQGKEEEKGKKFTPPTIQEIELYAKESGYKIDATKIFNYYDVAGWKDSKGNKIKNWKQKVNGVWFKEENKIKKISTHYDTEW